MVENMLQSTNDEEKASVFLRERFLYLISKMPVEKTCKIRMYESTEVSAKIKAFDIPFQNIMVENLETPQPSTLDKALIRTNDVISITYEGVLLE